MSHSLVCHALVCLSASWVSGMAVAQATAAVTQTIRLQVSGYPTVTLNPGPVLAPGAVLSSGSNVNAQVRIEPMPVIPIHGSPGWQVLADLRNTTTGPVATASATGRVEVRVHAAQPRSGVLVLLPYVWNASTSVVNGDVTVDTNCDNVPDLYTGVVPHAEIPLVAGPAGTPIWIDLNLQVSTSHIGGTTYGGATRTWRLMFVPDVYGITYYAPGCIGGASVTRSVTDFSVQVSMFDPTATSPGPTILDAWLLLGIAPTNSPLPVPPFCNVGVLSPAILAPNATSSPWVKHWELPAVQLPPGLQCFAQVVWLRNNGFAYTTDVLRTF